MCDPGLEVLCYPPLPCVCPPAPQLCPLIWWSWLSDAICLTVSSLRTAVSWGRRNWGRDSRDGAEVEEARQREEAGSHPSFLPPRLPPALRLCLVPTRHTTEEEAVREGLQPMGQGVTVPPARSRREPGAGSGGRVGVGRTWPHQVPRSPPPVPRHSRSAHCTPCSASDNTAAAPLTIHNMSPIRWAYGWGASQRGRAVSWWLVADG